MRRLMHFAANSVFLIVALVLLYIAGNDVEFTRPPINGVPYYGPDPKIFGVGGILSFGTQCIIWIVNIIRR